MFFNAVIANSLPLRATTPIGCNPVIESIGEQRNAHFPPLGYRRHALLSRATTMNLAMHGEATTTGVALEPGDPDYMTWQEIKARRLHRAHELAHAPHTVEQLDAQPHWERWLPEDFMGESEVFMLSQWVTVTDETCRVPTETIEELQANGAPTAEQPHSHRAIVGIKHLIKRNSMDGPIEAAIKRAGTMSSGAVWIHLRDLALDGTPPFTGLVEDERLHFTDDKNRPTSLSKNALKMRLVKHRKSTGQ
ncbi:hypothetical protein [Duganella violaceipulchra]|uniref:Uncharacterized protein n=1 Tax=Duganella violaceipulchra TaxID=2849652 RepID=A0AA41HJC6_9BURK|nr:hypothetical protein [Duganella violaceicalia]MBV6324908.1 hypothetical protein [Duganella violaceicalia]MCP2012344.1 hypothetical protein [Duganella violaceicalia]